MARYSVELSNDGETWFLAMELAELDAATRQAKLAVSTIPRVVAGRVVIGHGWIVAEFGGQIDAE